MGAPDRHETRSWEKTTSMKRFSIRSKDAQWWRMSCYCTKRNDGVFSFQTGTHEEKQEAGGIVTKNFTKKIQ